MKYRWNKFMFDIPNRQFKHDPKHFLYLAIDGSHSYGTSRPDSDVDIKGVYINPLEEYVSLTSNFKTKMVTNIGGTGVDLEVKPIKSWLHNLLKGNGNTLQNLFQEHIIDEYYDVDMVDSLKDLVMENGIHRGYVNFYVRFSRSQKEDFYKLNKVKCLLYMFRVLGAGIYLYENEKVEYNIHKIYEHIDSPYLNVLLENYMDEKSVLGTYFKEGIDKEYERLKDRLNEAVDNSIYPHYPKKPEERLEMYAPFNQWMEDLYGLSYR